MQRVVRLSLAGLLAFAGAAVTACGDKVTLPAPAAVDSSIHTVTVSPPSTSVNVGQSTVLSASVDAGPGATVRTVTWTSSDATIASVDQTGKVTGVKGGSTTIVAKSVANPAVSGAASITVNGGGVVTVSISSVNQNPGGNTVDLSNVHGQIDVTLNLDAPSGTTVSALNLAMNCNAAGGFPATSDTTVATQTISANIAPMAAEASAAPVTMSFNTAAFNSATGAVAFRNGACVLRAKATTSTGTQTASSATQLTLNNTDVITLKSIATTPGTGQVASATDANGLLWRAGAVNVAVVPVIYTAGRSIAAASISLVNSGNDAAIGQSGFAAPATVAAGGTVATLSNLTPAAGVVSASFANDTAAAGGVGGVTVDTLTVTVNTVDNLGNSGPSFNSGLASLIRLDNRAPNIITTPPTFTAGLQNTSAGWVGKAFVFSVVPATGAPLNLGSAATDNAATLATAPGVGKVVDTTQSAKQGTTTAATFANFTSVTALPETPAASGSSALDLRLKICDALGNCRQSTTLTTFGVDLTAPTAVVAAGSIANQATFNAVTAGAATAPIILGASDPQGANGATGSGFGATPSLVSEVRTFNSGSSGQTSSCTIGTPTGAGTACASPAAMGLSFNGTVTNPGEYTLTYFITDQAGNQTPTSTVQYYIDGNAPTVSGGLAIPASIVAGTTFSSAAADLMDLASANGFLSYPLTTRIHLAFTGAMSPTGVPFDNVLVRSGTATITLPTLFNRTLATITAVNPGVLGATTKPDSVGVRASDAVLNLSTANLGFLPAANIGGGAAAFTVGTTTANSLQAMALAVDNASVSNIATGTPTNPTSATFTLNVTAATLTSNTPFAQVCFYVITPSGTEGSLGNPVNGLATNEYSLLGCTSVVVTIDNLGVRTFKYTSAAFDPDIKFGPAAPGTTPLQFVAIGSNANGDGLVSVPVTVTLTNP